MKKFITVLLVIFIVLIFALIFYIGSKDLSNNETLLLTILLTMISILATYIASYYFSLDSLKKATEQINVENLSKLKTYAQKATEKVDNLSNELKKLSAYLKNELDQEYEDTNEEIISKDERIRSAIYIVDTLKSINDNALSDWKGVIPAEIAEREEKEKKKLEEIQNIIDRYNDISFEVRAEDTKYDEKENDFLNKQIEELRKNIDLLVKNQSDIQMPMTIKRRGGLKQDISNSCPSCSAVLTYRQRPLMNSVKDIKCNGCGVELISRWQTETGFYLELPKLLDENVSCPGCGFINTLKLNSKINSVCAGNCPGCGLALRVTRQVDRLLIRSHGAPTVQTTKDQITEELIEQVKKELPPQPWPVGIHREVGNKIGVPTRFVKQAMEILIDRGEAYVQHNGKIYIEKLSDV